MPKEAGMQGELMVMYHGMCPNCGGPVDSQRLANGLPCRRCMPEDKAIKVKGLKDILTELNRLRALMNMRDTLRLLDEYEKFSSLFMKMTGASMWGAQRLWAKRLIKGKSFAIVAPTGSGKTTFGIVASIYKVLNGGKVLMIFPTSTLAYQVYKKTQAFLDKIDAKIRVVAYNSLMSEKEREEALNLVREGQFDILIVTNAFLPKGMDVLRKHTFDLIFVDDVDSVMKASSRNIERILLLLGVTDEIISKALEAAKAKEDAERNSKLNELNELLRGRRIGTLIVSGMLTRVRRTPRAALFREILGFEAGGRSEGLRNVADLFVKPKGDIKETVLNLIKKLGGGGIVYVPTDLGREFTEELAKYLSDNGIKVGLYLKSKKSLLEGFEEGSIDVLIGLATSRSALVRGIDMPSRIRYVIFSGVPKMRFKLSLSEFSPGRYLLLLSSLRIIAPQEYKLKIDKAISGLRNILNLSQDRINEIVDALNRGVELKGFDKYASDVIKGAIDLANQLLSREDIKASLGKSIVNIRLVGKDVYVILPDSPAYIQGSGRTSRMYLGGISHGVSVVVVDDEAVFNSLNRDLKYRLVDFQFINMDDFNLDEYMKVVDEERKIISQILSGNIPENIRRIDPLKTALIIVESPTKARTIANFFGKPSMRIVNGISIYEVTSGDLLINIVATKGHVVELMTEQYSKTIDNDLDYVNKYISRNVKNYYSVLKIDGNFMPVYSPIKRCPTCGRTYVDDIDKCPYDNTPLVSSMDTINTLRDMATEVDLVLVGTDPDSEGEKIAWDVYNMLKPFVPNIRRIEFHEVTKRAILNALANPRDINEAMVKAQLIRRIEDRWIGFGLSSYLQRVFNDRNLSAGRVQTPVLKWIISRYIEFRRNKVARLVVRKSVDGGFVEFHFDKPISDDKPEIRRELKQLVKDKANLRLRIRGLSRNLEEVNPPPPFTTDTMLAEASTRLRMSTEEVMRLAQDLFEMGFITYHRTDSVRVSAVGISVAKDYITNRFGDGYFTPRDWAVGEVGAHECIRPTRPIDAEELKSLMEARVIGARLTNRHLMLYDLIFRRFMASQMASAVVEKAKVKVSLLHNGNEVVARDDEVVVRVIKNGFLSIYPVIKPTQLPVLDGDVQITDNDEVYVRTIHPVYPFREGEIVAEMKRVGIGRPSTYAKIIETLKKRGYVKAVGSSKMLIPTKRGVAAYVCLSGDANMLNLYLSTRRNKDTERGEFQELFKNCTANYTELISEERTRIVEKYMDDVENGTKDYIYILSDLFNEAIKYGIINPR